MSPAGSGPSSPPLAPSLADVIGSLDGYATVRYISIAFLAVLLYDHAITVDFEVTRIWTLSWRLPKFLFLINRYIVPPMLIFNGIIPTIYHIPEPTCNIIVKWTAWPTFIALGTIETLLMLRVLAIYGHSKAVTRFLMGLFIFKIVAWLALLSVIISQIEAVPRNEYVSGCSYTTPPYLLVGWIPPAFFESVIVIFVIYKILGCEGLSPTLRLLARDSMVYFVVMFSFLVANLVISRFRGSLLLGPPSVIACVAGARMTMNIRGLWDDDPNETRCELPTIRFGVPSAPTRSESDGAVSWQLESGEDAT